ncbi:MAG: hypothetical protein U0X20_27525 [Caldilineaceae bacterium]
MTDAFPIAINWTSVNKYDGSDWTAFNNGFTNEHLTLIQLVDAIKAGHAFTSPHRHEHPEVEGKAVCFRHSANWIESQHAGADHDELSIFDVLDIPFVANYAALVYTTPSHTEQAPRSRSVFILDQVVTDPAYYVRAMRAITWHLAGKVDAACKDAARVFYGSKDCTVRMVRNVLPLAVVDQLIAEYDAEEARNLEEAQRERAKKAAKRATRPASDNDDVICPFQC